MMVVSHLQFLGENTTQLFSWVRLMGPAGEEGCSPGVNESRRQALLGGEGFQGLGEKGEAGVMFQVELIPSDVSPGLADLVVRAAGCWWWESCSVRPCFLPWGSCS